MRFVNRVMRVPARLLPRRGAALAPSSRDPNDCPHTTGETVLPFSSTIMAWLLFLPVSAAQPTHEIQLVSAQTTSFSSWVIQLDSGEVFEVEDDGKVMVVKPEDSMTFEVVDDRERTRFLGVWSHYPADHPIRIELAGDALNLHQVVSASRIQQNEWEVPAQVTVVRPDEERERVTTQTSDYLKEHSEVHLQKTNLGGGSPIIRGMSGNRVLLMVDGFRVNNGIFRLGLNQYLNTVPAGQLEQIEILSGPTGVQYGSDGLGGTVHMRTLDPKGRDPFVEYEGMLSSADGTNTHRVHGLAREGDFSLSGHFSYNDLSDLEAADPVGEQPATGYQSWDGSINATWSLDEQRRIRLINQYSDARDVPRTDRITSGRDLVWNYDPQIFRLHGVRFESERHYALVDYFDIGIGYMSQE
jgi:hypothetical protein